LKGLSEAPFKLCGNTVNPLLVAREVTTGGEIVFEESGFRKNCLQKSSDEECMKNVGTKDPRSASFDCSYFWGETDAF